MIFFIFPKTKPKINICNWFEVIIERSLSAAVFTVIKIASYHIIFWWKCGKSKSKICHSDFTLTFSTFSSKHDVVTCNLGNWKTATDKNLSNQKIGFVLGKIKKNHQMVLLLKNVEKTYKNSDYSTTFTASMVAWVAKEPDNIKELACGVFLC